MTSVESSIGGTRPVVGGSARPKPNDLMRTALALMSVSSVARPRPAPTMAGYGLACNFLSVLPAIRFLNSQHLVTLVRS
jgi:glutamate:GABA antiporter